MSTVDVLVLDVNETLSDLEPLRARFTAAGLPAESLDTWFAATLRDGFALTAADAPAEFRIVGRDALVTQLTSQGLDASDETVGSVLSGSASCHSIPMSCPACGDWTSWACGSSR